MAEEKVVSICDNSELPIIMCRTCTKSSDLTLLSIDSILEYEGEQSQMHAIEIKNILEWITTIKILDEDFLPKTMCTICVEIITQCFLFRIQCLKSYSKLVSMLSEKTKNDNIEIDLNASIDSTCENNFAQSFDTDKETSHIEFFFENGINTSHSNANKTSAKIVINDKRLILTSSPKDACDDNINCDVKKNKTNLSNPNTFVCNVCGIQLKHIVTLKRHLMRHSEDKPFECKQCKHRFYSKGELSKHNTKHKTINLKHICEICGRTFSRKDALINHNKIHKGIKPHSCQYCSKRFLNPYNLQNHLRVHSKERPYICAHCNNGFTQRTTLIHHIKKMHKKK